MSDHIPDAGKMPADGYYICRLLQDTGGEVTRYVRVLEGRPFLPSGHAVLPSACSHFRPAHSWEFCGNWPDIAGREIETLRTDNAALVERMKRIEAAADKLAQRHILVVNTYDQAVQHVAEYHREKGEA